MEIIWDMLRHKFVSHLHKDDITIYIGPDKVSQGEMMADELKKKVLCVMFVMF